MAARALQFGSRAYQSRCTGARAALRRRHCRPALAHLVPCLPARLHHAPRAGPEAEALGKRGLTLARGRLRPGESLRTRNPHRSTPSSHHWPLWRRPPRRGQRLPTTASFLLPRRRASWGMLFFHKGRLGRRWQWRPRAIGAHLETKAEQLQQRWRKQRRALRWLQRNGTGPIESANTSQTGNKCQER